ncbi:hypothetical protein Dda_7897 [Drechslerella dactyloides]|uniref:Uncharacterized protein n=1 Tax=Drechslerella dactyloides TaxID=74499 RepID=A0AAD6ISA1_DREDA|nr:hypothetical protein Dda_7897 [Drechslerella dactyloides]
MAGKQLRGSVMARDMTVIGNMEFKNFTGVYQYKDLGRTKASKILHENPDLDVMRPSSSYNEAVPAMYPTNLGGPAGDATPHTGVTYPLSKPDAIALRFDALLHRQQQALRRMRHDNVLQQRRLASTRLSASVPKVGDVVLLKNTADHIPKLNPRALAGLFQVSRMAKGGKSAWDKDKPRPRILLNDDEFPAVVLEAGWSSFGSSRPTKSSVPPSRYDDLPLPHTLIAPIDTRHPSLPPPPLPALLSGRKEERKSEEMIGRSDTVVLIVILLLLFFALVAWLLFWARGPVTIWLTRKTEINVEDPEPETSQTSRSRSQTASQV